MCCCCYFFCHLSGSKISTIFQPRLITLTLLKIRFSCTLESVLWVISFTSLLWELKYMHYKIFQHKTTQGKTLNSPHQWGCLFVTSSIMTSSRYLVQSSVKWKEAILYPWSGRIACICQISKALRMCKTTCMMYVKLYFVKNIQLYRISFSKLGK